MSGIKDIIQVEEEAAQIVAAANAEAEAVKKEGREKAAAVLAEAQRQKESDLAEEKARIEAADAAAAAASQKALSERMEKRARVFESRGDEVARLLLKAVLTEEAE